MQQRRLGGGRNRFGNEKEKERSGRGLRLPVVLMDVPLHGVKV